MSRKNKKRKLAAVAKPNAAKGVEVVGRSNPVIADNEPLESRQAVRPKKDMVQTYQELMGPKLARVRPLSLEEVKKTFSLPVTNAPESVRKANDMAFDSAGGFNTIHSSLTAHAMEMGQYPINAFVGYGVLQQIAQEGMIRTCVGVIADDMKATWLEVTSADDTKEDKLKELQDLIDKKYKLRDVFHEANVMTGFFGGAFVFVDTGEENVKLPLRYNANSAELVKGGKLRFVVVDPVNCTPGLYNCVEPLKADYMKPKTWFVIGQEVHSSRMLRVVDNEPPTLLKPCYNFLGISSSQILWDYVMHWNKARVASVELLSKLSLLVVQTDMQSLLGSPNGIQDFDIRMQALQHWRDNDSIFVCDKDEEAVMNVQTSSAGATDIVRQAQEAVALASRMPAVKLFGQSPQGFSTGDTDIKNYSDTVHARNELRREAIQKCIEAIQLVEWGEIDDSITFKFNRLAGDDVQAEQDAAKARVDMLLSLLQSQVVAAEEVRMAVKNDSRMDLAFLSDAMPMGMGPEADFMGEGSVFSDGDANDPFNQFLDATEAPDPVQSQEPDPFEEFLDDGIETPQNLSSN